MKSSVAYRPLTDYRISGDRSTRVLIVDDHPAVRLALANTINGAHDLEVCGEAASGTEALAIIARTNPDAAVIDISLEDVHGLDLIETIRAQYPNLQVVVFSMYDESVYAERALRAGAAGYVMKNEPTHTVLQALRTVAQGEVYVSGRMAARMLNNLVAGRTSVSTVGVDTLTDREMAVFQMLGEGYSVEDISNRLHLARKTVEHHRRNARDKLGFGSTAELLTYAVQWMHGQGMTH